MNSLGKKEFKLGQMVLVHQPGGVRLHDGWMEGIPHCCDDPDSHWKSRIVGWCDHHNMPEIARRCRGPRGNTNHAEWPYSEDSLEAIEDDDDWTDGSGYVIGDEVMIRLKEETPQLPVGTMVRARLEAPHIEPEDWYVSFEVPLRQHGAKPGDTWRFKRVINETDFECPEDEVPAFEGVR